ncbi:hypothetical protein ACFW9X_36870, partial [Streptomyces sp. NPDC059466]|uniref:hypothetical protein n=1 Tax=Streptomyces sp. NPDC059466 TaxID=3346843 RepID=UPI0036A602DE
MVAEKLHAQGLFLLDRRISTGFADADAHFVAGLPPACAQGHGAPPWGGRGAGAPVRWARGFT